MTVKRIPVRYRRPREITPTEIWASPEPSDLMVWEVCVYVRSHDLEHGCQGCPEWENDPDHGKIKRGCRGMAEEACRVMMAVQRREH